MTRRQEKTIRPGHKQIVLRVHLVRFCEPSLCTGGLAVAVLDYRLKCGHTVRGRCWGPRAYHARNGVRVSPAVMVCPVCSGWT